MDEINKLIAITIIIIIGHHQHAIESSSGQGVEVGHVSSHLYNSIG